ncbi:MULTISPECIES: hypothetical protein [Acidiplasma]|jgi:hypothetical protein|uniref:Permease n=1 Tax=Acidiplasma aeolicum TaxID=507754 RepID=A0A0P9CN49_9ARCH|nr:MULTISPECIES: hypothetical protein [Acidiplasma]KJE49630.1 hypothetical protein TZ01_00430 [Acidiplasma sp. MBA-1]KPV44334.1 hypothetical protein SE19_08760 [Acidiplasma aeolicum]KQB35772.1 hypothetical protein AOG54_08560 [Acidiplasma aeolicum]WMT55819.1 MAG: hypothetical protein RE470_04025 [Acidiplasma sp.]
MDAFIFAMIGIFVILIGIAGYAGGFKSAGFAMAFLGLAGFLVTAMAYYSGYVSYSSALKQATSASQISMYQHNLSLNNFNGMLGLLFFGVMIVFGIAMYYLGWKEDKKIKNIGDN